MRADLQSDVAENCNKRNPHADGIAIDDPALPFVSVDHILLIFSHFDSFPRYDHSAKLDGCGYG